MIKKEENIGVFFELIIIKDRVEYIFTCAFDALNLLDLTKGCSFISALV